MKKLMPVMIVLFFLVSVFSKAIMADDQRDKGAVVLQSLSVSDGKIIFRTATGGCSDKKSFSIKVEKAAAGSSVKRPHYLLTIERVLPDQCKGFFPEGVTVEFDMEKDLGLKGYYTVSVINMVYPQKAE